MPFSEGCLESLRSLLRAHSEQLDCVRIQSNGLLVHLADALPSDLRRLEFEEFTLPSEAGDTAALRRTHAGTLPSGPGPPGTPRADSLFYTDAYPGGGWADKPTECNYDSLLEELAGLPRLRSLILCPPHPRPLHEVFREITPAVIPALEVVVVSERVTLNGLGHSSP
ncbi:hypothetical protein FOCC_FOCC017723, partial [Frankliniella occidentalis]